VVKYTVGARVRVKDDCRGVVALMRGRAGTVREIRELHNNGREMVPREDPYWVEFDEPMPFAAAGFEPMKGCWLGDVEIEEVSHVG
jgi:hypothetical protein